MESPPSETNRLFVVEQKGRIIVLTNLTAATKTTFLDLSGIVSSTINGEEGLLGLEFHPGFATNGYFFVFYTTYTNPSAPSISRHDRLSRFKISSTDPNLADANSEVIFINQLDDAGNHNGGDLQFGPDGYLYVSLGDEGGQADALGNSQRIDRDFFSGILRIDVDKRPGSLSPNPHPASSTNYAIPPDNPFVGATSFNGLPVNATNVRTEFWAVGLRNPWRFHIDAPTGWIFASDTGDTSREEINFIIRGGNYGWSFREGTIAHPLAGNPPAGFNPIEPIHEHPWGTTGPFVGKAIVGGIVYRGTRLPQINGSYLFGDYITGNFWALDFDGTNSTNFRQLFADVGITSFGQDPRNGDPLFTDQIEGRIKRIIQGSNVLGSALPTQLSGTGAFEDLTNATPNPGIVAYDLNLAFWSDNAHKTRWFSVPDTNSFVGFSREDNWTFPPGMVWIKTFELEMTNGLPASRRKLETRFLVRNDEGVYGITYRWNTNQTDALLLPDAGLDEDFVIHDSGLTRTQTWHYPSRNECLQCHTEAGGLGLGFNTVQLNREFNYAGTTTDQLLALQEAGYFSNSISNFHTLKALASATNETVSLDYRVRSYLAANCAQCHQPGAIGGGAWDARIKNPLSTTAIINGVLTRTTTNANDRIIVPGSLDTSRLFQRIAYNGIGRMPPLATSLLDANAIQLVAGWITNALPNQETFEQWQVRQFGSTNAANAWLTADPDNDSAPNFLEFLTGTNPQQSGDGFRLGFHETNALSRISFLKNAGVGYEVQWTTNVADSASWQVLNVPANSPDILQTTGTNSIVIPAATNQTPYFFRARVYEP